MYEYSYYLTYILLVTTGTITLVEALRTKDQNIRNILNLETCISIVAAYFYSKFIVYVENGQADKITGLRYVDWSITTPMMLLSLLLNFIFHTGGVIHLKDVASVLGLNYGMLLFGYLGEMNIINKLLGNLIGFLFYGGLFTYIYQKFMKKFKIQNMVLLVAYVTIWSIYGIAYFFPPDEKSFSYNVLDLTAKCFVGLFMWAYYAKVIHL